MKNWITILLFITVVACGEKQQAGTIPINKMKVVVWQLMQVDEHYIRASTRDSTYKQTHKNIQFYQQIFDLNKVDRVQFYKQIDYLEKHPIEFKVLMDSVNELSKREKNKLIVH